jgi:hypothetical protein
MLSLPWIVDKLAAEVQPAPILAQPYQDLSVSDLLPAGLNREVGLTECDDLLLQVGALDDQVAGVARELVILTRRFPPEPIPTILLVSGKIIRRILTTIAAGADCAADGLLEALPTCITKNFG